MPKIPSLSNKELTRLLEKGGVVFFRQGSKDHADHWHRINVACPQYFLSCIFLYVPYFSAFFQLFVFGRPAGFAFLSHN
jgi:hypothetical protein